jgi:hypothetical protein
VLAPGVADVLTGDDHPAVTLGGGDHRLEGAAVGLLDVRPAGELGAGIAQPQRQRVADALELAGVEHARAAYRADAPVDVAPGKGRGEGLAKLALELADLPTQLVAGEPLGDSGGGQRRD